MCDLLHRQILGLEVRPIGTPGSSLLTPISCTEICHNSPVCEVEDVPLSNTPSL